MKILKPLNKHCDLTFIGDVCPKYNTQIAEKASSESLKSMNQSEIESMEVKNETKTM